MRLYKDHYTLGGSEPLQTPEGGRELPWSTAPPLGESQTELKQNYKIGLNTKQENKDYSNNE